MKSNENFGTENTEKLLQLLADEQQLHAGTDKLSHLIHKYSADSEEDEELSEEELQLVYAAAKKPVPKYKIINDLL